jgi:malonate-semialdehyde dehydrogenase (acetylating)/methylmalonate-semialdehyde dehydrogenase
MTDIATERATGARAATDAKRTAQAVAAAEAGDAGAAGAVAGRVSHWINGRLVDGTSGRRGPVFDPATGRQTKWVDFASLDEVDAAVAAAAAAYPAWRATSISKRTETMFRIRNLVEARRREIAALLTDEHGKVPGDALGEIARGIENLEFACSVPTMLKGGYSEQVSGGIDVYQVRQPLGVVAGITPFNFPAMVPMWMFANAIACGNTFVLKPSEKDPSASIYLAQLLQEAGVPDGVFNVINGDKVAVDRILEHPAIQAVSFVGSTPIAKYIYETGTRHGKRVQALGGAKNHMIVLPDADLDMAADAAVSAAYGSSGERCMAISVVVAVGDVADPLVSAIRSRLDAIRVGPGSDPAAEMGPLVTGEHRDKVASYVGKAEAAGAKVLRDGRSDAIADGEGFFLGVSLIDNVTPEMENYQHEIFGPVLEVMRVGTYAEAVRLVNENPYGNGTAIFTRDGGAARRFQFEAQVGMVGINVPIPVPVAYYSFGGWKNSLFGDLHMYGPEGVQFYTRAKVVTARWPDPGTSKVDLGFPRTR